MKRYSILLLLSVSCLCFPASATAEQAMKLYYQENAQVELVGPDGARVFIDVHDPALLSSPPTAKDILLITHNHADHRRIDFVSSFPGPKLDVRKGEISLGDVRARSIPSAHNQGDDFRDEGGTNYIFVIDLAGVRIAHFGDIGQVELTPGQLAGLGKVDVAVTQLSNPFSDMSAANKKGFNLMDQVNPRLIIPGHVFEASCAKLAAEKWEAYNSYKKYTRFSADTLPEKTTVLFMGSNANLTKLPYSSF